MSKDRDEEDEDAAAELARGETTEDKIDRRSRADEEKDEDDYKTYRLAREGRYLMKRGGCR